MTSQRYLVFFDFDSTVVTKESLDEVIAYALSQHPEKDALTQAVRAITDRGMEGTLPFTESVRERFKVAPLNRTHFEYIGGLLTKHITSGMPQLFAWLSKQEASTYIVSGGFREAIMPTAHVLGVPPERVFTNECTFNDDGEVADINEESLLWTIEGKAPVIRHVRAQVSFPHKALLIGDGSNDLAAYTANAVDDFIGFGANAVREVVRTNAPHWCESSDQLRQTLEDIFIDSAN